MHVYGDERNYESRRYRHTADEFLNLFFFLPFTVANLRFQPSC